MLVRRAQLGGLETRAFELFDQGFDVPIASDVVGDESEFHWHLYGEIRAERGRKTRGQIQTPGREGEVCRFDTRRPRAAAPSVFVAAGRRLACPHDILALSRIKPAIFLGDSLVVCPPGSRSAPTGVSSFVTDAFSRRQPSSAPLAHLAAVLER